MAKLDPKAAGAALAAMLAIATPFVAKWEGYSPQPYADKLASGKLTVCFGETRVKMREYDRAECEAMLKVGIGQFAKGVARRNPELVGHPEIWSAASSLAYNVGGGNYDRSTVARLFSAGKWEAACDHFLDWRFAGGREIKGLKNRRQAERKLCLSGL